ncbi:hypothetical protein NL676_030158 [Syzygium grande]|nr:hypothetical protein NL676_030158 [Syzygium grande]
MLPLPVEGPGSCSLYSRERVGQAWVIGSGRPNLGFGGPKALASSHRRNLEAANVSFYGEVIPELKSNYSEKLRVSF